MQNKSRVEGFFGYDQKTDAETSRVRLKGQSWPIRYLVIFSVKLIEQKTAKNKKITLNLALNYGSKEEIINACKNLISKRNKKISINSFKNELYTKNIPDPEILIRTGGTKRLSNFLLWQLAYAEIFFVDKLWPDFKEDDFNKIVNKYYNIKRNFGTI